MAFIHHQSCKCVKSELDLFQVPPTQTSVESSSIAEYNPINAITHGLPIEFNILGTGVEYIDLNNTRLFVRATITRANGNDTVSAGDAPDQVGPVNLTLQSLFSEVGVRLNDTLVSGSNNMYPYRALIETLLS